MRWSFGPYKKLGVRTKMKARGVLFVAKEFAILVSTSARGVVCLDCQDSCRSCPFCRNKNGFEQRRCDIFI